MILHDYVYNIYHTYIYIYVYAYDTIPRKKTRVTNNKRLKKAAELSRQANGIWLWILWATFSAAIESPRKTHQVNQAHLFELASESTRRPRAVFWWARFGPQMFHRRDADVLGGQKPT